MVMKELSYQALTHKYGYKNYDEHMRAIFGDFQSNASLSDHITIPAG